MKSELTALQNLNHPYIVHTMDLCEDRDKIYVVQELIKDGNLLEALTKMSDEDIPFTEKDAANIVRKLLRGLAYIHESGYMHRDIKLENVMINMTTEESGKISFQPNYTDFGMATLIKDGEKVKLPVGTPLYMAPEILKREPYDKKVDIWALGVLTYIMLTSEPPYDANSPDELLHKIKNEEPDMADFSAFHKKGELITNFIKRCLKKDPNERPTALELLGDEWITLMMRDTPLDCDQKIKVVSNIKHFKEANIFQANIIAFLSGYVTEKDTRELLERSFIRFDKDGDGFISREEAR